MKRYVPTSVYRGRHNNFHSLEVVGRGGETQLQETDFLFLVSRFNGKQLFIEHLQFVFHVQTHKTHWKSVLQINVKENKNLRGSSKYKTNLHDLCFSR